MNRSSGMIICVVASFVARQVTAEDVASDSAMGHISFLKKLVPKSAHPHLDQVNHAVQALKHCVLFRSKSKQFYSSGKNIEERMKKDAKMATTFAAATSWAQMQQCLSALVAWIDAEGSEVIKQADAGDASAALKACSVFPCVIESMSAVGRHDATISVLDCLESKATEYKNFVGLAFDRLRVTSRGFYNTGAHTWKSELTDESTLDNVLQKAAETIAKVKSADLQADIKATHKACAVFGNLSLLRLHS